MNSYVFILAMSTIVGFVVVASAFIHTWERIRLYQIDQWRECQRDAMAANVGQGQQVQDMLAEIRRLQGGSDQ